MGYSREQGYTPASFETLMNEVRNGVNNQFGTSYTSETFQGTGFYRFFYPLVQRLLQTEVRTSEIFLKLQDYFATINARISRPVATRQGLIDVLSTFGYKSSIKPTTTLEAGQLFIAVDVDETEDDYLDRKAEILTIIKDSTVAGVITQGTEEQSFVLSNGQEFTFKFNLPDRKPTKLRVTITTSKNNQYVIDSPEEVRDIIMQNLAKFYWLGKNFEPQRYLTLNEAPYAESILFEYSIDDGVTWETEVYESQYDELLTIGLSDVQIIQE